MPDPVVIRQLTEADAERYSEIRLRSLIEHPEAFGSSPETHPDLASIRARFRGPWDGRSTLPLGAHLEGALVGLLVLHRPDSPKTRHKGHIFQMYVAPEARRRGIGRKLLERAIAEARAWGLEHLQLAVTITNGAAIALYRDVGFETWGVEPEGLRVGREGYGMEWMGKEL